jgi:hypothetical protein
MLIDNTLCQKYGSNQNYRTSSKRRNTAAQRLTSGVQQQQR